MLLIYMGEKSLYCFLRDNIEILKMSFIYCLAHTGIKQILNISEKLGGEKTEGCISPANCQERREASILAQCIIIKEGEIKSCAW